MVSVRNGVMKEAGGTLRLSVKKITKNSKYLACRERISRSIFNPRNKRCTFFPMQLSPISERALLSWLDSQASRSVLFCKRNIDKDVYGAMAEWCWQGKLKYSEENLSHSKLIHHRFHIDWFGIERLALRWDAGDWPYTQCQGLLFLEGGRNSPQWARTSSFTRFLDHTQRHTTGGRTPLDEWWARRRDLYLTKHNIHNRQTSMLPVGFEPIISAIELSQTNALDCTATGTAPRSSKKKKVTWTTYNYPFRTAQ
jgi:hypothetical protein